MSEKQNPTEHSSSSTAQPHTEASRSEALSSRPWYASPWLWGAVLFFAVLAVLAWMVWSQLQTPQENNVAVTQQQTQNAALEAKRAHLETLLQKTPCELQTLLMQEGITPPVPQKNTAPQSTNTVPSTQPTTTEQLSPTTPQQKPLTEAEAPPPPLSTSEKSGEKVSQAPATENTPLQSSNIVHTLENATVFILSQDSQGTQTGTGFFIAPGIILTNQHVVGTAHNTVFVVGNFPQSVVTAKVLAISPVEERDYAVLQVPITNITPLKLNLSVGRTQKVSTWGFPVALTDDDPKYQALLAGKRAAVPEVIYSEGTVSVIQDKNPPLIVHTAILSQGNSGGPLVNAQGDVVGINTYIQLDNESYRQSSLSIASKDIVAFLQQHNIPYTLAPTAQE